MITKPNIKRRFLAALIDYGIIFIVDFLIIFAFGKPLNDDAGTYKLTGFPALIPILLWGVMTIGLEYFLGSTLGNGIVGLKPIPQNGTISKISFNQSLKRHLLDIIDLFFFGLVAYLVIKSNPKHQRLGDIWAKTIVVDSKIK